MRVERRAEWSEEVHDWILPNLEFTGNAIKKQKGLVKAKGKKGEN
jgi:hypothetical protein